MMEKQGFWELLDVIDRALSQTTINQPTAQSIAHLLTTCRALQAIVQIQHEQIVDLNSRIKHGSRKEVW